MATISPPAPAAAPSFAPSESPAVVLPGTAGTSSASSPNDDHMMCDEGAAASSAVPAASASARLLAPDESTQGALDALAALAAASTAVSSASPEPPSQQPVITPHATSSDDDSEIMPPPPPRNPTTTASAPLVPMAATATSAVAGPSFTFLHDSSRFSNIEHTQNAQVGRLRSASNPEGMEKWDLYSRRNDRQHFVLPSSILEEELASTRRVLGETVDENEEYGNSNAGGRVSHGFSLHSLQQQSSTSETVTGATGFQQHWASAGVRRSKRTIARLGTSPDSVSTDLSEETPPPKSTSKPKSANGSGNNSKSKKKVQPVTEIISKSPPPGEEEDVDESTLEPEELLRRARSRLLEDLSEGGGHGSGSNGGGGVNGDKGGVLILPHSLSKYKEVYNKNGRIGIYTPAERAAIIQKFNAKRARRVWNKKIRYNCRKNLADRRMRVKGRFVKRSVEAANSPPPPEEPAAASEVVQPSQVKTDEDNSIKAKSTARSGSPPTSGSPLTTVNEEQQAVVDEEMPDVNDEEAGFDPSDDMPYRRTRRYTIT